MYNNIIREESRLKNKVATKKRDFIVSLIITILLLAMFIVLVSLVFKYGNIIISIAAAGVVKNIEHNLCMMVITLIVSVLMFIAFWFSTFQTTDSIAELRVAKSDLSLCQRELEFELAKLKNSSEEKTRE